jgi:hypothetical protein
LAAGAILRFLSIGAEAWNGRSNGLLAICLLRKISWLWFVGVLQCELAFQLMP